MLPCGSLSQGAVAIKGRWLKKGDQGWAIWDSALRHHKFSLSPSCWSLPKARNHSSLQECHCYSFHALQRTKGGQKWLKTNKQRQILNRLPWTPSTTECTILHKRKRQILIFPLPGHAQTLITVMLQEAAVKPDPNTATIQAAQWSQPQALPDVQSFLQTSLNIFLLQRTQNGLVLHVYKF